MQHSTHIHILLDRSGSMASIADDVIGGFNTFLKEQQANGPDARLTLVQFDSQDAQDVILSGSPIMDAKPLNSTIYRPRGGTPLLDATGRLIERAMLEEQIRSQNRLPQEDIVFVSITDGEENQSREYTLEQVRNLIAEREAAGWTFVFLSAALDAYGDATKLGIKAGSIQAFMADKGGVDMAMESVSYQMREFREKKRSGIAAEKEDFFGPEKPAEKDRVERG
jgi:Mg-chelatase subunit ChlD